MFARSCHYMAERGGFEPPVHLWGRTHDFQSCSFGLSDISPASRSLNQNRTSICLQHDPGGFYRTSRAASLVYMAERGGFEPPWELLAPKSISSRSRYDHFGISPHSIILPWINSCYYPFLPKKSTQNFSAAFLLNTAGYFNGMIESFVL